MDHTGNPHVVAGNNALVARLKGADGSDIAFRIVAPGGKDRDWAVRYAALAEFQARHASSRAPGSIRVIRDAVSPTDAASFGGNPEGSGVGIVMEWIQGPTLHQAVDRAARTGNVAVIRALYSAFVRMWNDLVDLEFVHGDLTASNILVRPSGHLVCVDLDSASWRGSPLGPSGDGSPGYRHPTQHRDAEARDLYAALVMMVSLSVLADAPELRRSFGDEPSIRDGVLLFSAWDLAHVQSSPAIAEASKRVSGKVGGFLNGLIATSLGDVTDLIEACGSLPGVRMPAGVQLATRTHTSGWDATPFLERIRARYGDSWTEPGGDAGPPAPASRVPVQAPTLTSGHSWPTWDAPAPVESGGVTPGDIEELKAALSRNDETEVIRIWTHVSGEPLAALLAAQVEGVLAASYDRRILDEAKRRSDAGVVGLGGEAEARRIPLGPRARSVLRMARERLDVQDRLDRALAAGDREELTELAVSGRLVVLGETDRQSLQKVIQAIEWPVLVRAIVTDDDVLIDAAFDDELFGEDDALDSGVRDRVDLARARLRWLVQVRSALAKRQSGQLRNLLVEPPEGAADRLGLAERRRIRRMIEQERALSDLTETIESGDDAGVIAALNRVERAAARVEDRATWSAIQRVVERVSLIDSLLEASRQEPLDYGRIAELLPMVRTLGFEHNPRLGGSGLVQGLEGELTRMAHARRIQAAIARDNDLAIVTAAVPDPRDALALLTQEQRDRVAAAIWARRGTARSLGSHGEEALDSSP